MADDDKGKITDSGAKPTDEETTKLKAALDAERKKAQEAENQLKALRVEMAKAKADSDSTKSEQQKLLDRIEAAERKATEAESRVTAAELEALKIKVADAKGLTPAQARRLVGTTREELEADAEQVVTDFKLDAKPATDDGGSGGRKPGVVAGSTGRPRENLRSGAMPPADAAKAGDEYDTKKLLEAVPRG